MWQYAKSTQQYKAQVQILYFVESDTSLTKEDILVKKKKPVQSQRRRKISKKKKYKILCIKDLEDRCLDKQNPK